MHTPSSIFLCQTTLDKAKFLEFGIKNAKLATLIVSWSNFQVSVPRALPFRAFPHRNHVTIYPVARYSKPPPKARPGRNCCWTNSRHYRKSAWYRTTLTFPNFANGKVNLRCDANRETAT